jgi:hypothetical protein
VHHYRVFGGCLRSEVEIRELASTNAGSADWTLRVVPCAPGHEGWRLAGEEYIGTEAVRLYRGSRGFRFTYSNIVSFDISARGDEIGLNAGPEVPYELISSALLGPVLALALHASGRLCLHGSSVTIGDEAVAFLAPKHYGKSTLAMALVAAGASLVTDDTLAVGAESAALAWPGVHSVRLWDDSLASLPRLQGRITGNGKRIVVDFPASSIRATPIPLNAVYVLRPVRPDSSRPAVQRDRLPSIDSALALVAHTKIGALAGNEEAAVLLRRCVELARAAPVYALHVARGFDQLDEVVGRIMDWHQSPVPSLLQPFP